MNRRWPLDQSLRSYLGVFAVAFAARALYLLEMRDSALFSVLFGDAERFDAWARRIAGGDWFGDQVFYFAPLYPYSMAGVYGLFGPEVESVRWAQALLGALTCVLAAATARRLFDRAAGWAAGLLLALYPPAIFFDGLIQKTSLGAFLAAGLLWLALHPRATPRILLATGACLGLLALTRENALALLPVVAAWVATRAGRPQAGEGLGTAPDRRGRRRLVAVAWLLLGAAAILLPVGWRNAVLGGRFLPTTAQAGPNFYIGNHRDASGLYDPLPGGAGGIRNERQDAQAVAEAELGRRLTPAEVSSWWLQRALADIRADPGGWVALMARKGILVWQARELIDTEGIELYRDESRLLRGLSVPLGFGALLALAAVGLWRARRRWQELWLLYAVILVLAASVALFFVTARYRFSLVPALVLFAGAGLAELARLVHGPSWPHSWHQSWQQRWQQRWHHLRASLVAAALALGLTYWPMPLAEDPRAITLYNLGLSLAAQERLEAAEAELDRALERKPSSALVLAARGTVRRRQQRLGPAIEDFERALERNPSQTEALAGLGRISADLGLAGLATAYFERQVTITPQSPDALANLGNARRLSGRLEEAAELYRQALRLRPNSFEITMSLAQTLAKLGQHEPARQLSARAERLRSDWPEVSGRKND